MNDRLPTASARWWLNLQIAFGAAGGLAWLAGAMLDEEFVTGVGCGLLIAALLLRFGRRAADAEGEAAPPRS